MVDDGLSFFTPYRAWLFQEFSRRQTRNPSYSLRAFAKALGVSRTCLSSLFLEKRHLSPANIKRISKSLALDPLESELFAQDVVRSKGSKQESVLQIAREDFRSIHTWYHFALLSLARLGVEADSQKLADRIGVDRVCVEEALASLIKKRLIAVRKGQLTRLVGPMRSTNEVSEASIRDHHRQMIQRAYQSLETVPMERRCYQAITMAMDPKNLHKAKKLMEQFRDRLSKLLERGEPSEVYTLSMQLFPTCVLQNESTSTQPDEQSISPQSRESVPRSECL